MLLGRTVLAEDGRLIAVPAGTIMKTPIGIGDGADAVRFLGVSHRVRRYETKDGGPRVSEAAKKSMREIGCGLILNGQQNSYRLLRREMIKAYRLSRFPRLFRRRFV